MERKIKKSRKKKITKRVEGKQINKWVFIQEKNVLKKVNFTNNLMQNSFVVYLFQDYKDIMPLDSIPSGKIYGLASFDGFYG